MLQAGGGGSERRPHPWERTTGKESQRVGTPGPEIWLAGLADTPTPQPSGLSEPLPPNTLASSFLT